MYTLYNSLKPKLIINQLHLISYTWVILWTPVFIYFWSSSPTDDILLFTVIKDFETLTATDFYKRDLVLVD